jgi:hypothetical protein
MERALKLEANQAGKRHAIVARGATFSVIVECENYVHGRNVKAWRLMQAGMSLDAASALFSRKIAGKAK